MTAVAGRLVEIPEPLHLGPGELHARKLEIFRANDAQPIFDGGMQHGGTSLAAL